MIARTPDPPYVAVIFTSVRSGSDDADYHAMSAAMAELALEQPGYLGIESARSDGTGITVSYWTDEASARAWKAVAAHREAQHLGRSTFYDAYTVRIASVLRAY